MARVYSTGAPSRGSHRENNCQRKDSLNKSPLPRLAVCIEIRLPQVNSGLTL
jgi:hypothetical protein